MLTVGSEIKGYRNERLLGRGGMGEVYEATQLALERTVALKVLPSALSYDVGFRARFRREGQAARRFRHPNAVTVYDLRTASDGTIYMVMEYVEGQNLRQALRRFVLTVPSQ